MDQGPVDEIPEEELVTTGNRSHDFTEGECSTMFLRVREAGGASYDNADHVQSKRDRVVLWDRIV